MNDQGGGTVINNQDITITTNGEYTAESGYTGIGTATVNVPEANVITATNNTGSSITEGDKVWINENSGSYTIENYSSLDSSNLKINGTLNISNGIASGFGVSNFITVGNTNFDLANHWSFETEITTGNDVSTFQMIFPENRVNYNSGLELSVGYFRLGLSNTHTSINIGNISSITIASANTTYKLKVEFTGTAYNLYVNDILEGTLNSTAKLLSWIWNLGCANTNNPAYAGPFLGSINLNKTKITAGGFTWTPNIQNVSQNSLSGIAKENIASGSAGQVETVLPE